MREKKKYLVQWKWYTAEIDTWKERENTIDLVEEFEQKYGQKVEREEIIERCMMKVLYRQEDGEVFKKIRKKLEKMEIFSRKEFLREGTVINL